MDKKLWWVHNKIIIPASMAVAEAERVGLLWDLEGGRRLKAKLSAEAREMTRKANKQMPIGMTVTSPNDLRTYLFDHKKFPVISETEKGTPQVNEYSLTILAENHKCKIAKDVINIREMEKIVGTYLKAYPKFVGHDGRIHATCWFTHTVTGRTAFTQPNPQQLPRRKDVRELIMAEEGNEFIYGDLATAEMRIAGSLSRDPFLIDVFKNDGDVHLHMGAEIAGIPVETMDIDNNPEHKDWRQKAKPVNFGFLYGQMPPGFVMYAKANYGVDFTLAQAEDIRDRYFTKYAALPGWYREVYDELYRTSTVRSEFGRLRRFPGLHNKERWEQEACERQAVNMLVQSVAADIMLLIFIFIQEHMMREKMKTRLILTVHDSLLGEGPSEELPEIASRLDGFVDGMSWPWLRVPMRMDIERGPRWSRTKKMKKGEDF
jgi:DNA polymerase-1